MRRRAAWTGLLLCLVWAYGGVEASVLCFGADGHVALEADAGGGSCRSPAGPASPAALAGNPQGSDAAWTDSRCNSCTDVPVSLGALTRRAPAAAEACGAAAAPSAVQASAFLSSANGPVSACAAVDRPHRAADATHRSLRSTVLLI